MFCLQSALTAETDNKSLLVSFYILVIVTIDLCRLHLFVIQP